MKKLLSAWVSACTLALSSAPVLASEPVKVAFVDTGNTGRSVTAEALALGVIQQKKLPIAVISRGVDQDPFDAKPEPNVVTLLSQRGVDVSAHRSVQLNANDIRHADVILTLTAKHKAKVIELFPEAKDKTFQLAEYATGQAKDVDDAWGKPMDFYQNMFKQVEGYMEPVLTKAATLKKP